jgi:hypothetical protein
MWELRKFPTQDTIAWVQTSRDNRPSSWEISVWATVHALIDRRMPKIYTADPTTLTIPARGFFAALNQWFLSWDPAVTIIPNPSDDTCILQACSHWGDIYEITGEYFVEITKPGYNEKLVDYTSYLSEELSYMGITVSIHYTDMEHILDDTEIESYFPESIPWRATWEYSCEIYNHRHNPEWSASVHSLDKEDVTLLDIIFAAIDDLQCNGYSYEGMALDIICNENKTISMKTIPAGRLEDFIRSALIRVNPLYQNFSYKNAINSYLDHNILKYLI